MDTHLPNGHRRCVASIRNGEKKGQQCTQFALAGSTCCRHHLRGERARANAAVRATVQSWVPGDITEDAGEVMLRMVTGSWRRCVDLAHEIDRVRSEYPTLVEALAGDEFVTDMNGKTRKSGEYLRVLFKYEAEERERAVAFSKTAVMAGLAERTVRVAEKQAEIADRAFMATLAEMGFTPAEQTAAAGKMARHLVALESA